MSEPKPCTLGEYIIRIDIDDRNNVKIGDSVLNLKPIVRCKDCKHQNWVNAETGGIICKIGRGTNAPDWFCADGEQRENE